MQSKDIFFFFFFFGKGHFSPFSEMAAFCLCAQANSAVALGHLSRCVKDLAASIAERLGVLSAALEGSRKRREEALSAQASARRDMLEHAGMMAYTHELLKETDQPCFVQAARVTHNRLFVLYIC